MSSDGSTGAPAGAQAGAEPEELTVFVQNLLQQMQARFQAMSDAIITKIDEMGGRIDELERNIGELVRRRAGRVHPSPAPSLPPSPHLPPFCR
jgi:heat shock factor-binding protein 1